MREVVFFTKPGCHLCDEAKAALGSARDDGSLPAFTVREVDIAADDELMGRYGIDIPVGEVGGVEAFRHRVDDAALARLGRMLAP